VSHKWSPSLRSPHQNPVFNSPQHAKTVTKTEVKMCKCIIAVAAVGETVLNMLKYVGYFDK
jgi:hypothetical protein